VANGELTYVNGFIVGLKYASAYGILNGCIDRDKLCYNMFDMCELFFSSIGKYHYYCSTSLGYIK